MAVKAKPEGYHNVTPYAIVTDANRLIDFLKSVFGGEETVRLDGPDGKVGHAEIQIGDSILMLNDVMNEPAQPAGLFLYVPDVDKTFAKALKAGATALMPPQDMFWGDRFGRVQDPSGNKWGIATHREDVTPKEMKKRAATAFAGAGG